MTASDKLQSWALDVLDQMSIDRQLKLLRKAEFDKEACYALNECAVETERARDAIADLKSQCFEEHALVLLHAVWAYARKNNNQHLMHWEAFNEEVEGAMQTLISAIEDRRNDELNDRAYD